jgi:hypothetical protein
MLNKGGFAAHALTIESRNSGLDPPAIRLSSGLGAVSAFEPTHAIVVEQTWCSIRSDVNSQPPVKRDGFGVIYFEARPAH